MTASASSPPALVAPDGSPLRARGAGTSAGTHVLDSPHHAASPISQELASWTPGLLSADREWGWDRDLTVSRIRDLVRNNGTAAGAVRRFVDHSIGAGLRLQAQPDYRALGITREAARELGQQIEAAWREYANDPLRRCDKARRTGIGGLMRLAYFDWLIAGESLTLPLWRPGLGEFATCFQAVDPDRLSNPAGQPDGPELHKGVALSGVEPVGYHIRKSHPSDAYFASAEDLLAWDYVPRETAWGRPSCIHFFAPERADQSRGKPPLAAVVQRFKMLDRYQNAELAAALLNAIFCAAIESPMDTEFLEEALSDGRDSVSKYQDARADFHADRKITLAGATIPHLFPGEKLSFPAAQRPAGNFPAFEQAVLRHIAAGTGQSFEQVATNYSQTNYSSARAALLDAWKSLVTSRTLFTEGWCRPAYLCWLEEAFDRGIIRPPKGAPSFHEAITAYTAGRWLGPGRGWIDPTKEAQGAQMRMDSAISTLEVECAEYGLDWEEVLDQRALEQAAMRERGLLPQRWETIEQDEEGSGGRRIRPARTPSGASPSRGVMGRSRIPTAGAVA